MLNFTVLTEDGWEKYQKYINCHQKYPLTEKRFRGNV